MSKFCSATPFVEKLLYRNIRMMVSVNFEFYVSVQIVVLPVRLIPDVHVKKLKILKTLKMQQQRTTLNKKSVIKFFTDRATT